jgi:prevent-host-death family protein
VWQAGLLPLSGDPYILVIHMTSYSVADAKARFSEMLDRVSEGEEVLITRYGKPVARLVPDRGEEGTRQLGWAREQIQLLPGWDEPVTEEKLAGE